MKRNSSILFKVSIFALIVTCIASCKKNEVKKVEINNQIALSLFEDTIKVGDLLNIMDSTVLQYFRVKENGNISIYFADSINNIIVTDDILSDLDDINFDVNEEFEIPYIPEIPIPDFEYDTTFSLEGIKVPFEYEGYELEQAVIKKGKISFDISCNLPIINEISLSTDDIKLSNGDDLCISLNIEDGSQNIEIDLTDCSITPEENSLDFTITARLTITSDGLEGGLYHFNLSGKIDDMVFKSIDGSIEDIFFDFEGKEEFTVNFPNLYGDFKIATPNFSIKYVNTFGFEAQGFIDSLYLTTTDGSMIGLIKDWNNINILLNSTGNSYDSITDLDDQLIDAIDLLEDYSSITFNGNIIMGCDEVSSNMISEDSHIDMIADLLFPLELNIDSLMFIDTIDFNLNLNSENEEGNIVESLFDELEFKFVFRNRLPFEIKPQAYMMENGVVIDTLLAEGAIVHAGFENNAVEDIIKVSVVDSKLHNIQQADKLMLKIGLSSCGEDVAVNKNDYFNLRIGLKTKTTEINLEDINF